jgi:hypothetical protein
VRSALRDRQLACPRRSPDRGPAPGRAPGPDR